MAISSQQLQRIEALVAPAIEALGFSLVQVRLMGGEGRPTLQVMAERTADGSMTVDDCAAVSRTISAVLDVEDPVPGAYLLEVSSPGIDRPLVRREDYERFAGFEARVETRAPLDGRKRFRGRLLGLDGDDIRMEVEPGKDSGEERVVAIPLDAVNKAKLLLTDELIEAALKKQASQR